MKKKQNLFPVKGLTLLTLSASLRRLTVLMTLATGFALTGVVGCTDSLAPMSKGSVKNPALTSMANRGHELQSVQSIGLAPIYFAGSVRSEGSSRGASRSNLSGSNRGYPQAARADALVGQDDVKALNEELLKSFDAELSLKVLHLYKGEGQADRSGRGAIGGGLGGEAFDFASSAEVGADAILLGRRAGVDAVLITNIKSFQERVGSAIGSETPARVSFTMSLVRVSDRSEIWSAIYTFQDRSLLDNLTTLGPAQEGGLGWRKAREIVAQAFANSARDLEDKRLVQFLRR